MRFLRLCILSGLIWLTSATVSAHPTPTADQKRVVDLNSATVNELQALPGIGPSKAIAIVQYRTKRRFRRAEELIKIKGIGRKTFRKLRHLLTVRKTKK